MLTACGIETHKCCNYTKNCYVATVLTACGIETSLHITCCGASQQVATVLTACGIETSQYLSSRRCASNALQQCLPLAVLKQVGRDDFAFDITVTLQQCLPLAVLKHNGLAALVLTTIQLQQCLPLAVLKQVRMALTVRIFKRVATVLTACGIETSQMPSTLATIWHVSCNSAYRLRY